MESREIDYLCKILIIGDKKTGKTCLSSRFTEDTFSRISYNCTFAAAFSSRIICLDNQWIKTQIWDLTGDSQYRLSARTGYKSAHGVVIVYDSTDNRTFENVPNWLKEVEKYRVFASPELKLFLMGNKCDLSQEKEVEYSVARMYADKISLPFMEVSAKDGSNVELAFVTLLAEIIK